jgi:hypothetical protein
LTLLKASTQVASTRVGICMRHSRSSRSSTGTLPAGLSMPCRLTMRISQLFGRASAASAILGCRLHRPGVPHTGWTRPLLARRNSIGRGGGSDGRDERSREPAGREPVRSRASGNMKIFWTIVARRVTSTKPPLESHPWVENTRYPSHQGIDTRCPYPEKPADSDQVAS